MTRRQQRLVGLALAVATTIAVVANQRSVGIARDEVVYMQNGARYADWWTGLVTFKHGAGTKSITDTFGGPQSTDNNREHPPLMKTLFGFSERIFHDGLGVMSDVTAFRFPSAVMEGVCVWLAFDLALAIWGFAEAVIAALLLALLPRALFHAGLACFDAPIMTLWLATVVAYWRAMDGRKWPWAVGVAWGCALTTKHTAFLLPFALGIHYVVVCVKAAGWRGFVQYRWRVIVSLAVLGPLTLIALWPWLWLGPISHIQQWLAFHTNHVHYNFEYLGHNWNAPRFPWHVALVTTLFTVPVGTLAAAVVGFGVWIGKRNTPASEGADAAARDERRPALLLALSAVASIGPFLLGTTPIFGAEKHWMPALPTLCIAAGVGAVWAARAFAARVSLVSARVAVLAVGGALVAAAGTETVASQPYALTWYNALAGGAPGGADLGMNRQFWGVAARGVLPLLATQPPGAVYSHDASPAWGLYMKDGFVPRNMPDAGMEEQGIAKSQYALVIHEKHFNRHDYLIWKSYNTVQPFFVLRADGVPIVSVYRRAK